MVVASILSVPAQDQVARKIGTSRGKTPLLALLSTSQRIGLRATACEQTVASGQEQE
jgi:hypothetical protein